MVALASMELILSIAFVPKTTLEPTVNHLSTNVTRILAIMVAPVLTTVAITNAIAQVEELELIVRNW